MTLDELREELARVKMPCDAQVYCYTSSNDRFSVERVLSDIGYGIVVQEVRIKVVYKVKEPAGVDLNSYRLPPQPIPRRLPKLIPRGYRKPREPNFYRLMESTKVLMLPWDASEEVKRHTGRGKDGSYRFRVVCVDGCLLSKDAVIAGIAAFKSVNYIVNYVIISGPHIWGTKSLCHDLYQELQEIVPTKIITASEFGLAFNYSLSPIPMPLHKRRRFNVKTNQQGETDAPA